ncbi:hypothetical protein pEaSNUABM54_00300 [Erwinia phage pEa_SNUABM_54]|nr:hypothetical protein pEaSNUABM54_00300 [Erwinia phage pEa_SNUABM_54]
MSFNNIAISPIKEHVDGVCETTPIGNANFWTVYGVGADGLSEALVDVVNQQAAVDYAQRHYPRLPIMQLVPDRLPAVVNAPPLNYMGYEVVPFATNAASGDEHPVSDEQWAEFWGLCAVHQNDAYTILAKHDTRMGSELLLRELVRPRVDLPVDNLESDFTD